MLSWALSRIKCIVNANGLAGAARRISEAGGVSVQAYEWRMRVYNLGVVGLIVLTVLTVRLSSTLLTVEKSLALAF